nr:5-(carboxyamino)imidazole ribonucleotide synthase [uncultured Ligilactobacillus sp.]
MNNSIKIGSTIGIIGGGQLGQMLAQSARQSGMKVIILDPQKDCPAALFADGQIVADYSDEAAIRKLVSKADVLTYEFENVDLNILEKIQNKTLLPQGTHLLKITKDRLNEKNFLKNLGLRTAEFSSINTEKELKNALDEFGYPSYLKTCEGGYDGKNQMQLKSTSDFDKATTILQKGPCILEKKVVFKMECSVMVGRNVDGEVSVFPVSENIHRNQILHESIVPARISEKLQNEAQLIARKIAEALNLCGILGIEMFIGEDDNVYVNELAPRPHNSGHYSIEACNYSQFDIHNRAICNWKMPEIKLLKPVVMVNVLGQHLEKVKALVPHNEEYHFHDYWKTEARVDRKMGHVTILTNDIEKTLNDIEKTNIWD